LGVLESLGIAILTAETWVSWKASALRFCRQSLILLAKPACS